MRKTLTAGLTALSLILVPAAPVQAQTTTENDAIGQALVGLLAAGLVGLAISKSRDKDDNDEVAVRNTHTPRADNNGHRFGDDDRRGRDNRGVRRGHYVDPLPHRCFRQIELGNGRIQNVYAARCLERRYRDADTLPRRCETRLGGRDGSRLGYDARCLRDRGYQSDRRW